MIHKRAHRAILTATIILVVTHLLCTNKRYLCSSCHHGESGAVWSTALVPRVLHGVQPWSLGCCMEYSLGPQGAIWSTAVVHRETASHKHLHRQI